MNCTHCQHENDASASFCEECGARLGARKCAACGAELKAAAKFCPSCGTQVGSATDAAPAPRAYTPKHLADKILQSKSALEGERKQVTVLFADVKGSMELAGQLDAEEWHSTLDRFFQILTEGVHRFEGTVNQYTGDGIMALFGAPIAHEDHAQRACYAALHLRDELRKYADELRVEHGLNFFVRMGINSGAVVVGKIGDDLRMDYTAQGHTVGLAARMEQLAEPGSILMTDHTAKLVVGYFQLRSIGPTKVKGVTDPLPVHELEGLGTLRTRLEVSRTRGFSNFVGRGDEMKQLEAALDRAGRGEGGVVGVVGEAGVGKSRLCFEFVQECRRRGFPVHEGHSPPHGKTIPFHASLQILRSMFGLEDREPPAEARRKIAGTLSLLDPKFRDVLPLVFDFLGVPDEEFPPPKLGPEARRRQLLAFFQELAVSRSRRELSVILMDDVHWIDPGSDSFLAHAAETVPQTRTLVLLNFRPEYSAAWMQRSYYQQIPLRPLGQAASESILNDLLGEDPSLEQLKGQIREKTTGNPFFMEELVHSLSEAGSLVGQPGSYRLVEPTAAPTLPPSVQAVLDARIDRLDERDKMALQAAAVIGPEFAEPLLRRVTDLEESELAAALSRLCQSEFLFERALYPEAEYAFVHPLTQEVAYGTQLREHKMVLHRAAAAGLEELDPKKLDENAALIAHHLEEGGEHLASARWHARAAKWTHDTNATESARHWRQVRTLLEGVPESDETLQLGLRAVGGSLDLAWRVGSTADERTELFRHGEALASRTGDPSALPRLYCIYGLLRQAVGDLTPGRSYLLKALEGCRQAGNPEIQASALSALVYWDLEGGNLREAASRDEELERVSGGNVDLGSELHGFSPYLMNLGNRAAIQMYLGRLEDAARTLEKARELALKHSDLEGLGNALGHSTTLAGILGNSQEALRHARSDVDAAERLGSPAFRSGAYCALGKAFVFGGEWSEAIAACEGALALTKEAHLPQTEIDIFATLVRARLGAGKIPEAREAAEEAVKLAGRFPQLFMGGLSADLALVRFLLRGGGDTEYQRIEAVLDRIEHDAREREIALYIPLVHGERAELAQLHGDANRRMRELREAHRLFTEMGATGQAERISRELK